MRCIFLFKKLKKKEVALESSKRSFGDNATTALSALLTTIVILALVNLSVLFPAGCFITKFDLDRIKKIKQMKKLIAAFRFACAGLLQVLRYERNFQIECCCAVVAVCAGYFFSLSQTQWLSVVINIGLVLSAELFNTAIEKLCNKVSPEYDPLIKAVKDSAAAAVMVSAVTAVICGAIIFIPHIIHLIKSL